MSAELGHRRETVRESEEVHSEGEGEGEGGEEGEINEAESGDVENETHDDNLENDADSAAEDGEIADQKSLDEELQESESDEVVAEVTVKEENEKEDIPKSPVDSVKSNEIAEEIKEDAANNHELDNFPKPRRLSVKEDRKNPTFVPKSGQFYLHDTRDGEDNSAAVATEYVTSDRIDNGEADEENESDIVSNGEHSNRNSKKKERGDLWGHDLYNERDQAPLTTDDIIRKYGYDIRAYPPGAPPPSRSERTQNYRGRGHRGRENGGPRGNDDFFQPRHKIEGNSQQRRGPPRDPIPGGMNRNNRDTRPRVNERSGPVNRNNRPNERQRFENDFPALRSQAPPPQQNKNWGPSKPQTREFIRTDQSARNVSSRGRLAPTQQEYNHQRRERRSDLPPPLFDERYDQNGDAHLQRGPNRGVHSATVNRVTQQQQQQNSDYQRRGSYPNRGQARQRRPNLPEWATEDAEGRWEPPSEEEQAGLKRRSPSPQHPPPQQQQPPPQRGSTTYYNRNIESKLNTGGGQAVRYSSMRNAGNDHNNSSPRHSQQQTRYGDRNDRYESPDINDDYDSQGEADWHRPMSKPSPPKGTPNRGANPPGKQITPSQKSVDFSDKNSPSQVTNSQPTDATAIATATIQQLLTNPTLLQQLLIAATSAMGPAAPGGGQASAVGPQTATAQGTHPPVAQQVYAQSPQQTQQPAVSTSSQNQSHIQAPNSAVYRAPVPPAYYWPPGSQPQPVPGQPATAQTTQSSLSTTDLLNNMTPQQAAALQAAAVSVFAGGSAQGSASLPQFLPPQGAAPSGAFFLTQSVPVDSSAAQASHFGTPPQHAMRHAHQPHH